MVDPSVDQFIASTGNATLQHWQIRHISRI